MKNQKRVAIDRTRADVKEKYPTNRWPKLVEPATGNAKPECSETDDHPWVKLFGDAVLRLSDAQEVPAKFMMSSVDGMLPGHVELTVADPDIADLAWHNGQRIELEICGAKIRTQIIGQNKLTHVLWLPAASLLRGLARAIAV